MIQTLDDLRAEIDELHRLGITAEYKEKQLHKIPIARVVDRVQYILEKCKNRRVLHLGCGWPGGYLHQALYEVTSAVDGVDIDVPISEHGKHSGRGGAYWHIDLDQEMESLPQEHFDVVVCAEILEHLGNPGNFLKSLKGNSVLITVPNAFARGGYYSVTGGIENVNRQHVCYYSYWTLRELVTRYGYGIEDFMWYNQPRNGQPQESEGLIMLVR